MKTRIGFTLAAIVALALSGCGQNGAQTQPASAESPAATYLIIQFQVTENRLEDFLPIMTGINEGMASEEGFVEASVYRNTDDPLAFTLVEKWQTRALHEAHYDRIVASGDWDNILSMLSNSPKLEYTEKL